MKNKFNVNLDNEFYLVICDHKSGPYTMEIPLADMTKKNVMKELIEGQYDNPIAVIYFNPAEGHSSEVSEDFALDWINHIANNAVDYIDESGFEPEMRIPAFIKMHLPDYEAYAAEVMDDYRLNRQDPDRLYGVPARI